MRSLCLILAALMPALLLPPVQAALIGPRIRKARFSPAILESTILDGSSPSTNPQQSLIRLLNLIAGEGSNPAGGTSLTNPATTNAQAASTTTSGTRTMPVLFIPSNVLNYRTNNTTSGYASNTGTITKHDGRLRMCPPGGSSFTMAWSMACSMRRKKRDLSDYYINHSKRALIAPSIRQLQKICCNVGCTVSDLLSYCGPLSGW